MTDVARDHPDFNASRLQLVEVARYTGKRIGCCRLSKFDVEILAVNENTEILEGQTGHDRLVILKFPSRDEALRWYNSPEYQEIIGLRLASASGSAQFVEGVD